MSGAFDDLGPQWPGKRRVAVRVERPEAPAIEDEREAAVAAVRRATACRVCGASIIEPCRHTLTGAPVRGWYRHIPAF